MVLITGGKYQGKRKYAMEVLGFVPEDIEDGFCETVRAMLLNGENPWEYAEKLIKEKPDAVILADEAGSGIIPQDEFERYFREEYGRIVCFLSQKAQHVYRVCAGLGLLLK